MFAIRILIFTLFDIGFIFLIEKFAKQKRIHQISVYKRLFIFLIIYIINIIFYNIFFIVPFFILCIICYIKCYKKSSHDYYFFVLYFLFKIPFEFCVCFFLEFIFNLNLLNPLSPFYVFNLIICQLFSKILEFCFILMIAQEKIDIFHIKVFKYFFITICIFTGITIVLTTNHLFHFQNVGRTFVFVVIIYNIALIMFDRYQVKHEKITQEMMLTTQRIESEKEYLMTQIKNNEEIRKMRHDLKNHFLILNGYMKDGDYDDAKNYLHKHLDQLEDISKSIHCGNSCIDSVIESKRMAMIENDIEYKDHLGGMYIGDIDETDLALIIALALDNAIEASLKLESGRKIEMISHSQKNTLILHIQNKICKGENIDFNKTSKIVDVKNHGIGVKEMKEIARRYDGSVNFDVGEDYVDVRLCFTLFYKKDD